VNNLGHVRKHVRYERVARTSLSPITHTDILSTYTLLESFLTLRAHFAIVRTKFVPIFLLQSIVCRMFHWWFRLELDFPLIWKSCSKGVSAWFSVDRYGLTDCTNDRHLFVGISLKSSSNPEKCSDTFQRFKYHPHWVCVCGGILRFWHLRGGWWYFAENFPCKRDKHYM
jgi:hypothetical protein